VARKINNTGKLPLHLLFAVFLIRCYQSLLRPFLLGSCKFHPTCSEYAAEAFSKYGLVRGGILAIKRLSRCHPFGMGGFDPVPQRKTSD
jgi:uncharacterized protein